MPMMLEKLEACPTCGEVKRWLYDAQMCSVCGEGVSDSAVSHEMARLAWREAEEMLEHYLKQADPTCHRPGDAKAIMRAIVDIAKTELADSVRMCK